MIAYIVPGTAAFPASPFFLRRFSVSRLTPAGEVLASLEVLPAEEMGFLEKNQAGITMMFGVIIASGIVKMLRYVCESLLRAAVSRSDRSSCLYE